MILTMCYYSLIILLYHMEVSLKMVATPFFVLIFIQVIFGLFHDRKKCIRLWRYPLVI